MKLETIIGLEIHLQLKTKSKMFCSCDNRDVDIPNKYICPVCSGQPGTLPTVNKEALMLGMRLALAINCEIQPLMKFDRKNYFYPDLPKGYQISQFDKPLALHGYLVIEDPKTGRSLNRIRINRLHLEEDAGKLIHTHDESFVDFNRCGTPLAEIVTEPDFHSAQEAKLFLQELQSITRYSGVSEADMEKGHMRCDANISLRPVGEDQLYPKTEVKNLNSFKAVERALMYEEKRQQDLWVKGQPITKQSTRGWDESKGQTLLQREKEEFSEYRYFPEPDLPPLTFTPEEIEEVRAHLPELPETKRKRFVKEYGLNLPDAVVLVADKNTSDFFEQTVSELVRWLDSLPDTEGTEEEIWEKNKKKIVKLTNNWITTELFKLLNENNKKFSQLSILPENMAEFITLIYSNKVNSSAAQTILKVMFNKGGDPSDIVEELDLHQVSNEGEISEIIAKVIATSPDQVQTYKKGKTNIIQYLVGQVMKESKGKVDPQKARELLEKALR